MFQYSLLSYNICNYDWGWGRGCFQTFGILCCTAESSSMNVVKGFRLLCHKILMIQVTFDGNDIKMTQWTKSKPLSIFLSDNIIIYRSSTLWMISSNDQWMEKTHTHWLSVSPSSVLPSIPRKGLIIQLWSSMMILVRFDTDVFTYTAFQNSF